MLADWTRDLGTENNIEPLDSLNSNIRYDLTKDLNLYFSLNDPEYDFTDTPSDFFDSNTFISKFKHVNKPLYISLNIQSLMSKFNELKEFINLMLKAGLNIEIIALQEIWAIQNPDLINIPGFNFISKERKNQRGVGLAFT